MQKGSKDKTPELYYRIIRTRLGRIGIAATKEGVVRIELNAPRAEAFKEKLRKEFCGFALSGKGRVLDRAEKEIKEYLAGGRKSFTVPVVVSETSFRKKVYSAVRKIPYGKTESYRRVAVSIGSPGASRAVGTALKFNPVPLIIPCHRVIASNGSLGGFSGGLELKKKLLALEGAHFKENRPVDVKRKKRSGRRGPRC